MAHVAFLANRVSRSAMAMPRAAASFCNLRSDFRRSLSRKPGLLNSVMVPKVIMVRAASFKMLSYFVRCASSGLRPKSRCAELTAESACQCPP